MILGRPTNEFIRYIVINCSCYFLLADIAFRGVVGMIGTLYIGLEDGKVCRNGDENYD